MSEEKPKLYFATENLGKFKEAYEVLSKSGIEIYQLPVKKLEIQSDDLEEIAKFSAEQLAKEYKVRVLVEDAGLFIDELKGFPGPFSSYTYKTIGIKGILKLMENVSNRDAYFKSVVCYCSPSEPSAVFVSVVRGVISTVPRGSGGFGFDPIFIPEGSKKTFAEMDVVEKNLYSHRAKSFNAFAQYYLEKILKSC